MEIEGYCMKCKAKRTMKSPKNSKTKRGVSMVRGICPHCGCKMCKMGVMK